MKTKLKYGSALSGVLILFSSLFYACKKEKIERNASDVQLAIIGVNSKTSDTNSTYNIVELEGVFISDNEFEIEEFGAVLFDTEANLESGNKVGQTSEKRTKPGNFIVTFAVLKTDTSFVKLYAQSSQGKVYSGNLNRIHELKEGAQINASIPGTTINAGPGGFLDYGTRTTAIPLSIIISNVGIKTPLVIQNIRLDSVAAPYFTLTSPNTNMSIDPGKGEQLSVSFDPNLAPDNYICRIIMNTNIPEFPEVSFFLELTYSPVIVVPPPLKVVYNSTDYLPGASFNTFSPSYLDLAVVNTSSATFDLDSIKVLDNVGYYIEGATGMPMQLEGNSVGIKYFTVARSTAITPSSFVIYTSVGEFSYNLDYIVQTPPAYSLHPQSLATVINDFDEIVISPASDPLYLDIANTGDQFLEVNGIGINNENFNLSTSGPLNVPGQSRTSFSITHPSDFEETANLTISTKTGVHNYTVRYILGFRLQDTTSVINPGDYIYMNDIQTSKTVTLYNTTTSNFTFDASVENPALFSLTLPSNIPPGGSAQMTINAFGFGQSQLYIQWGSKTITYNIDRPNP